MLWFAKGIGEPFPGARQQFPEVCGPADPREIRQEVVEYQIDQEQPHKLDKPEGEVENKYGLWGQTRRREIAGDEVDITTYSDDV